MVEGKREADTERRKYKKLPLRAQKGKNSQQYIATT
jgi:hypothetical protein